MTGMGFHNIYWNGFGGIFILLILLIVALISFHKYLFGWFLKSDDKHKEFYKDAKSILAEKLSLGEISIEEYQEKLDVLDRL